MSARAPQDSGTRGRPTWWGAVRWSVLLALIVATAGVVAGEARTQSSQLRAGALPQALSTLTDAPPEHVTLGDLDLPSEQLARDARGDADVVSWTGAPDGTVVPAGPPREDSSAGGPDESDPGDVTGDPADPADSGDPTDDPPPPPAPPAPTGLVALSAHLANELGWDAGEEDSEYVVYRSDEATDAYVEVARTTEASLIDTVSPDALGVYSYRVSSIGPDGLESVLSDPVSATTVRITHQITPSATARIVASTGEVMLVVPAGSVASTIALTIDEIEEPEAGPAQYEQFISGRYAFGPSGTSFARSVRLYMEYDFPVAIEQFEEDWLKYAVGVFWRADGGRPWKRVTTTVSLDTASDYVSIGLTHFSDYASGFTVMPHGNYSSGTNMCSACHQVHGVDGRHMTAEENSDLCLYCHGNLTSVLGGAGTQGGTGPNIEAEFLDCSDQTFSAATDSRHPIPEDEMECSNCHTPHRAPATYPDLLFAWTPSGGRTYYPNTGDPIGNEGCWGCHGTFENTEFGNATYYDDTGGDHKTDFTGTPHASVDTTGPAESECLTCHIQHGQEDLTGLVRDEILGVAVSGGGNAACFACHGSASTGFPNASRTASGYPTQGSYPGSSTYTTTYIPSAHTGSIHSTATAVWPGTSYAGGDCKNCHDIHGSDGTYDYLRTEDAAGTEGVYDYTPGDMSFCFNCHDAGGPAGGDIKQYYPVSSGGTSTDDLAGHQIQTSGGNLSPGTGLPCYDCHNPHGSASAYGLQLTIEWSVGTTMTLGDAAGEISLGDATGVREFCFGCHTTADTSRGFDGSGYTDATGTSFEGLSRIGGVLGLPSASGHNEADTQSCYQCHGNSYAGASSNNIHNPIGGGSDGGIDCYACHGDYQQYMEDNTGSKTGSNRTTYYHHVLGSSSYDGDESDSFYSSSYPGAGTDVYCLSCHVDHDKFNSSKGSNLRADMTSNPSAANSDYSTTSPYGVCIGCHSTARTKDTTNQNSSYGSGSTAAISGADYDLSAHDYTTSSDYSDATSFNANCVKCHSDFTNETTDYQSATGDQFALHYSAESRILNAFGATVPATDQLEEDFCFECHSTTSNPNAASNLDAYGVAAMDDDALAIEGLWTGATSEHPVGDTNGVHAPDEGTSSNWNPSTGRHVECEDCHNPHEATDDITDWPDNTAASTANIRGSSAPAIAGANKGVWGIAISGASGGDWTPSGTFGSPSAPTYSRKTEAAYQWELCLKCHGAYGWGSSPPEVSINLQGQTGGKQTDVGTDFSPLNYSIHPIFDTGKNQPPTNANTQWGSSGSSGRRNIGGTTDTNGLSNTFTDGWLSTSRVVCTDCHNNAVTSGASGPHASDNQWLLAGVDTNIKVTTQGDGVVYPNSNYVTQGQGANFCVNCHRGDVYGSEAPDAATQGIDYGDLSRYDHDSMNDACGQANNLSTLLDYAGCLNCHGARKDENSYKVGGVPPANTVVQSGAIHGTSMGDGPGSNYSDPMGYRFRNGASWASQGMGDASGTGGCQNFTGAGSPGSDDYSSCTKHGSRAFTPEYYYARPTS